MNIKNIYVFSTICTAFMTSGCGSEKDTVNPYSSIKSKTEIELLNRTLSVKEKKYPGDGRALVMNNRFKWMQRIELDEALSSVAGKVTFQPVIAVLDSGIDYEHPAFENRIVDTSIYSTRCDGDSRGCDTSEYQFPKRTLGDGNIFPIGTEGPGRNCISDAQGDSLKCFHGTHVAGIAAGFDPDANVFGVCPTCRILPVKVVKNDGNINDDAIIGALEYIADLKRAGLPIRIINCSFGKFISSERVNRAIKNLSSSFDDDILIISSAGNENTSLRAFPAALSNVISVANVNSSNLKKDEKSNFGPWVDISAPVGRCGYYDDDTGYGIVSSIPGTGWNSMCLNGTSMAAPMVSGVAGLVLSTDPGIKASELKERLVKSADAKGLYESNPQFVTNYKERSIMLLGSGILNARNAVNNRTFSPDSAKEAAKRVDVKCAAIGISPVSRISLLFFLAFPIFFAIKKYP
ncbi:MAG: S8 family serine peptidase [Oligoflexales bacterium]|nr:S8 family serine peptidase [Oligoflexales bacterium]